MAKGHDHISNLNFGSFQGDIEGDEGGGDHYEGDDEFVL